MKEQNEKRGVAGRLKRGKRVFLVNSATLLKRKAKKQKTQNLLKQEQNRYKNTKQRAIQREQEICHQLVPYLCGRHIRHLPGHDWPLLQVDLALPCKQTVADRILNA